MLPNLAQLALVDTGGFYALTDAERQQVEANDVNDPITYERPTHTMTFRIQMSVPNPDGTPRYYYYSPASLWDWMRQPTSNGKFPHNPDQRILYEDWWTLHMNYDPQGPIPSWVWQLEQQAPFLARMAVAEQAERDARAREAAERAQREQRERERARREAEAAETERQRAALGSRELAHLLNNFGQPYTQTANGEVVLRWRFWVNGPIPNIQDFPTTIKMHFAALYQSMQSGVSGFSSYVFETSVARGANMAVGMVAPYNPERRELRGITFAVKFSRRAGARAFLAWATSVIERYGLADFVRRAHHVGNAFGGPEFHMEADLPKMVELGSPARDPQARPMLPPSQDANIAAQPTVAMLVVQPRRYDDIGSITSLDTAYPVPPMWNVRWNFWLKGTMDNDQIKRAKKDNKRLFAAYMTQHAPNLLPNLHKRPWNQVAVNVENVKLAEEGYRPVDQQGNRFYDGREGREPGIQPREYPAIRCKFLLKLPRPYADEFVAWFTTEQANAHNGDWSRMYRAMVQLGPSKIGNTNDLPTSRDSDWSHTIPTGPIMTEEVYNAWGSWTAGAN